MTTHHREMPETEVEAVCEARGHIYGSLGVTHSCRLAAGHDGKHVCPVCGDVWTEGNGRFPGAVR